MIGFFIVYNVNNKKYKENLLSENTAFTYSVIIGNNTYKSKTNYLQYIINDKKYETRPLSTRIFNIGEYYKIEYSKTNPEVSKVDYTSPIIFDLKKYKNIKGQVTKIFQNESLNILSFTYLFNGENYNRDILLKSVDDLKKNNEIDILVKIMNPKISYLKDQVQIKN